MTEHALDPKAQLDPASGAATPAIASRDGDAPPGVARDAEQHALAAPSFEERPALAEGAACTQSQLRRFIKSRPYVPLHELRRRFGLNGGDDDVSPVDVDGRRLFIGLPARESSLLGDLLRQGDVGYELLLDPTSPIIIGVFPMRPVQRP